MLPKLDGSRISTATEQLIKVLDRKFVNYLTSDFCSKYESIGGVITSPLPIGNKLSNGSWSKLILTPEKQAVGRKWKQVAKEVISEPTIEQFSRTLEGSVCNEPVRFASFALSLPKDIILDISVRFFEG